MPPDPGRDREPGPSGATNGPAPELPPQPDPNSGEPRPPRAPVPRHEATRTSRARRTPEPPDGRGPTPVMAHYREQARYALLDALKATATFAIFLVVLNVVGSATEIVWIAYPVTGIYFLGFLLFRQRELVSCGVEWVQHNHHWIHGTYELDRIDHAYDARGKQPQLVLDKHVHRVKLSVDILGSNQELWDYIHLALRHSAVNGAEITATAREQLPELAALERPRRPYPREQSSDDERSTSRHKLANHHRGESIFALRSSILGHLRFHDKKHRP